MNISVSMLYINMSRNVCHIGTLDNTKKQEKYVRRSLFASITSHLMITITNARNNYKYYIIQNNF